MSYRRSLSFAEREKDLVDDYDNNGGSDYAKFCMKFTKQFYPKMVLIPEGMSLITNANPYQPDTKKNPKEKTNFNNLIK